MLQQFYVVKLPQGIHKLNIIFIGRYQVVKLDEEVGNKQVVETTPERKIGHKVHEITRFSGQSTNHHRSYFFVRFRANILTKTKLF